LKSFHRLLELYPEYACQGERCVKLVLIGGSRNEEDAQRVKDLRDLAMHLGIAVSLLFTQAVPALTDRPGSRGLCRERSVSHRAGLAL